MLLIFAGDVGKNEVWFWSWELLGSWQKECTKQQGLIQTCQLQIIQIYNISNVKAARFSEP